MLQFNQFKFSSRVFLFVVFALMLVVGCSNTPLDPQTEAEEASIPNLLQRSAASSSSLALSPLNLHTEAVIPAATGGQLVLFDVILEVPAGAVSNDTLFTIDIPDINVFYNEFGTNGLVFDVPVKITMSYRDADLSGVNVSTIRIGWFNRSTGLFEDVVCDIDYDTQTVVGYVDHFSAYALISD